MLSNYVLGKFFNNKVDGIMVEVGAAGPNFISQSKPFKDVGWRCICVEPNPEFAEQHREVGNEIYEYACSYEESDDVDFELIDFSDLSDDDLSYESYSSLGIESKISSIHGAPPINKLPPIKTIKVNVRKLNSILEEASISKFDYLIIDVEGWELEVMDGFNSSLYQPKVIVLENLGDPSEQHDYMSNIGYRYDSFDRTDGPNYIYVRQ